MSHHPGGVTVQGTSLDRVETDTADVVQQQRDEVTATFAMGGVRQ